MGKIKELMFPVMAELPDPEIIDIPALLEQYNSGSVNLIVVLGPTASGKTRYAVSLARELNKLCGEPKCEILSADSRQVYRGMDIGTGKDLIEYEEIPYHLIDIADAGERYSLFEFQRDFEKAYADIRSRGCIPILCGGTGLYIQAAADGYSLPEIPADFEWRAKMEEEPHGLLQQRLLEMKPDTDSSILESKRRTIRAIEVALYEKEHPVTRSEYEKKNVYYIGTLVTREVRTARIDKRLDERLAQGMIDEVKGLLDSGVDAGQLMAYGLEYKFITQHILGILTYDEMRTLLANAIHQFAKRQMTWFRGMEKKGAVIHWTEV